MIAIPKRTGQRTGMTMDHDEFVDTINEAFSGPTYKEAMRLLAVSLDGHFGTDNEAHQADAIADCAMASFLMQIHYVVCEYMASNDLWELKPKG